MKNDRPRGPRDERGARTERAGDGRGSKRQGPPARGDRPNGHRGSRPNFRDPPLDPEARRAAARAAEQRAAVEIEPQRTCIITKKQLPPSKMLRLAWIEDALVAGPKGGGRGSYISIERQVFDQLDVKSLSRAFRAQVKSFDRAKFLADLHATAERKVLDAVGLARRMGILVAGVDRVPGDAHDGVLLLATDLAERSSGKLPGGKAFVSGATLGSAAGMGFVGAAFIPGKSHHITNEAAYWLAVWYESAPDGQARTRDETDALKDTEALHG